MTPEEECSVPDSSGTGAVDRNRCRNRGPEPEPEPHREPQGPWVRYGWHGPVASVVSLNFDDRGSFRHRRRIRMRHRLRIAEGRGRSGKDRDYHFRVALGSAREVEVHLRLLLVIGSVDRRQTEKAIELFDRVCAMTWRLLHPKR